MTTSESRDRRRSQRYLLTLGCDVVRIRREAVQLQGRTRNLSAKGAYFVVDGPVEPGAAIEFLVTLQEGIGEEQGVKLRCRGHVVRLDDQVTSRNQVGVAATIDRYQFVRDSLN